MILNTFLRFFESQYLSFGVHVLTIYVSIVLGVCDNFVKLRKYNAPYLYFVFDETLKKVKMHPRCNWLQVYRSQ